VISCESEAVYDFLVTYYTGVRNKLLNQHNGIDPSAWKVLPPETFPVKEKIILVAGRIGVYQKNHELLLEVLSSLDLQGWKVIFAGPVEPGFRSYADAFLKSAPQLQGIISFTGNLDMDQIGDLYRRSRLLVLSSRFENFPLVVPEAMYYGCYVISTDVGCIGEILKQGALGTIVKDGASLGAAIQKAMTDETRLSVLFSAIKTGAVQSYSWSSLLRPLAERISNLEKQMS